MMISPVPLIPHLPYFVPVIQPEHGWSEWTKTLITAGIGAIFGAAFGIGGNVLMEYLRPGIQQRNMVRSVKDDILPEAVNTWRLLESSRFVAERYENESRSMQKAIIHTILNNFDLISQEVFEHYNDKQKSILFKLDPDGLLGNVSKYYKQAANVIATGFLDFSAFHVPLCTAAGCADRFIKKQMSDKAYLELREIKEMDKIADLAMIQSNSKT